MKTYYVYILASNKNGTLYTGITSNLRNRIENHKIGSIKGFTSKYKVNKLVYVEVMNDIQQALRREKQIKNWKRVWKIELIEKLNPTWDDLSEQYLMN